MRAFLENMLNQLNEFFGRMTKKEKTRLGILAAVVVILAIIIIIALGRTTYAPLHTAINQAEVGIVVEALQERGEDYRIDGMRILVPDNRVSELKGVLANAGVIGSATLDYSLLESAAGFNITDRQANELYARQKAAEIRTQILLSDNIQNAVVTINPGQDSPYVISQGVRDATAAVMLVVRGGAMLTASEAQRIADLVKNNVPGVKYENITITDSRWNYYQIGDGTADLATEIANRNSYRNLLQQQFQIQCEQLIVPIFGLDNLRISASVTLNFDKEVTEQIEFFPPIAGEMDGIVRSAHELYENQRNAGAAGGVPGTDTNAMGTVEYPYAQLGDGDEYRRAVLDTNYEINETRRIIEHEQGKIQRVTIGISINKSAIEEDYTAEVRRLVSGGLGIHQDNIVIEHLPFLYQGMTLEDIIKAQEEAAATQRRREMLEMIIKYAVIAILIVAVFLLARMVLRILNPAPEQPILEGVGVGIDYIADDDIDGDDDYYDPVVLQTKSTALEQIERFIDSDPGAVAQLLRNWLTDD